MPLPPQLKGRKPTANKKLPFLSQEFIIKNHADIISCILVVIVFGMLIPLTSPLCSIFISMANLNVDTMLYSISWKDAITVFFYSLLCVIIHSLFQEYILDKLIKRMHLSKTKTSKFTESGQLLLFYAITAAWAIDILIKSEFVPPDVSNLWVDFPHYEMKFSLKFYYIIQFAYWMHTFPELYFQKVKREELWSKSVLSLVSLVCTLVPYVLNLNRLGLVLLFLHNFAEGCLHLKNIVEIVDKEEKKTPVVQLLWEVLYGSTRVLMLLTSSLCVGYGLRFAVGEVPVLLAWVAFVTYESVLLFKTVAEHRQSARSVKLPSLGALLKRGSSDSSQQSAKKGKFKARRRGGRKGESDLTEVDQELSKVANAKKKKK